MSSSLPVTKLFKFFSEDTFSIPHPTVPEILSSQVGL